MSDIETMLEGERRGLLSEDDLALLAEARRRGLIGKPEETWGEYAKGLGRSAAQGLGALGDEGIAGVRSVLGEDYDTALADERKALADFQKAHPIVSFGAEVAGSLPTMLIPGTAPVRAATLGARVAQSAKVGAGLGTLYGFGAGEGSADERIKSAAQGAVGGAIAGPIATEVVAPAIGKLASSVTSTGASRAATVANAEERLADMEAFRAMGIEPFGPSLADKGPATAARGIEQLPIIGRIVKEPKTAVETKLAAEQDRLASSLGAPASDEDLGLTVQRGLDRYRTAGLEDLEPDAVRGLGVEPMTPTTKGAPGEIMIKGAAPQKVSKFDTSMLTTEQLEAAGATGKDRGISFAGSARRNISDLGEKELKAVIDAPAHQTSFATRQEALYERAYRSLPSKFKENSAKNPNLIATPNASSVATGLLKQEKSANISGGILDGRFGKLVESLRNPNRNFTIDSLRAARTEIGRALNNFSTYDARLDRGQLKQLYGAISKDIEGGVAALAARARKSSRLSQRLADGKPNPEYISPADAAKADKALYNMRLADRYTRASIDRMDSFMKVLGANTLDEAGRKIGRFVRENTTDLRALRTMRSALRPEEWNAVAGHVAANLGKGRAGAKEAEAVFNVSTWATDWNKIAPQAKDLLFGASGQVRQSLDNFARVAERMKYYETTRNTSGTGYTLMGVGALQGAIHAIVNPGLLLQGVATAGGTAALAKFMTSKAYVSWLERAYRMETSGASKAQWQAHLNVLSKLAGKDAEIGDVVTRAMVIARTPGAKPQDEKASKSVAFIPLPKSTSGAPSTPTGVTPELPSFKSDAEVKRALASGKIKRGDRFRLGDAVMVAP